MWSRVRTLVRSIAPFFSGDSGRLLLGNGLAQVIAFAGLGGISRLYDAGPLGTWSTCVAFITFVWSFSQLRTDMTLMQETDRDEKRRLLLLGGLTHVLFSGISWTMAIKFGLFKTANNFLIFSVLLSHWVQQMAVSWQLSERAYREVNWLRLANVIIAYPGSLVLYYWNGEVGLLWALLAGNLVPALLAGGVRSYQVGSNMSWHSFRALVRKHLPTLSWLSLGNLLLSLSEQGMILLISLHFEPVYTAAFFLAARVCNLPLSFVQSAMSQYNLRYFQDLHDAGQFSSRAVWVYWKKWLPIGVAYFVPVVLFGPWLFMLFFGNMWAEAGEFARILGLLALIRFLSSPTSMGFFVLGKQRVFFGFTLLFTVIFGATVFLAWIGWPLLHLVALNAGLQIVSILAYNYVMLRTIDSAAR